MNRFVRYAGVMFSFFITANFYIIVYVSMLSTDHAVTVYFNHFGEAVIEYIIYIAIGPILLYSFYCEVSKFRRSRKNAKKRHAKNSVKNISRIKEEHDPLSDTGPDC